MCREEDGAVDPQCFSGAQTWAVRLMEEDFFPPFLSSDFHCKHQIDLLTTTNVHLADIIYNEAAMFYFSEVGVGGVGGRGGVWGGVWVWVYEGDGDPYCDSFLFQFMEQEGGSKLLQCFLAIHNFQEQLTEQYGEYDGTMAQDDAMVIYDK